MSRILVTGGAGFIGSHLCERLLERGNEVVCLDNFFTGTRKNVDHLLDDHRFELVRHDVTQPIIVEVDEIYHLACPASPIHYQRNPVRTIRTGVQGTLNMLDMAREIRARVLIAATSEVYGDPKEHPQTESYWGNANPIGPRACYDEAKRCAEALTVSYARQYGVQTRIARIFNSVLADQTVILFNDSDLHIEPIGEYADHVELAPDMPRKVLVPAFDPQTLRITLQSASALIKHPIQQDAFELKLRYGRSVKVTGDHSVFVEGADGRPEAKPVRDVRVGDHVAIAGRMPVVEHDRPEVDLAEEIIASRNGADELWNWSIVHPKLKRLVVERREDIHALLADSGRFAGSRNVRNTIVCATRKWMQTGRLPLAVLCSLRASLPANAKIVPHDGSNRAVPNRIPITPDTLWLLGFFLAEGSEHSGEGVHFISFASDERYLRRAQRIIRKHFGVNAGFVGATKDRAPSICAHSKILHTLFCRILRLRERRIPAWVMQLPLARVKHFLEGFRCGDGTHSGKKVGNELCFDTTSEQLALDLNYLLLRFGIVASFGRYETTFRKKYGDRRFPFYRLTICEVDNFNILAWDRGVHQTLNARRSGDLVWSMVREVRPCLVTGHVYDFEVPGSENFLAGNGVCCHNTYGPRMHENDGRVVSNFAIQALRDQDITIYGAGTQTRSFCYVTDTVEAFQRMMALDHDPGPINIGNPHEQTIRDLAEQIIRLTGSRSSLRFNPLPVDDPVRRNPDITKARALLGWEPTVTIEDGLTRTLDYFRNLPTS
jgi:UDP-glucuronate decarboxylase